MTDTTALDLVADLRQEVAGLVAKIDTIGPPPPPDEYRSHDDYNPGPAWIPVTIPSGRQWIVRIIAESEAIGTVFVATPDAPCRDRDPDLLALDPTQARRLAMALLAAADRADTDMAGVIRLNSRRSTA